MRRLAIPLFTVAAAGLLAASPAPPNEWTLDVRPLDSPAVAPSAQPQLTTSKRGILLSWIERQGTTATLKFAERTASGWSEPRTVASGSDWFVNWADVPSVVRLDNGTLAAHWLQKSGPGTYAYDVRLSYSTDDGRTWQKSFLPHHDGTQTEHGFATLFDMPGGGMGLVWLDGRAMTGGHGAGDHGGGDMALRFGAFDARWKQVADTPLDLRVCECCPTAVALTADGPLVAYRDRGDTEIRDIYVTRLQGKTWTEPKPVHADNWRVPACPVNGPALSARGRDVAVTWFNAKDDQPRSFAAFSRDSGTSFGTPVRIDDQASLGRVDVELLEDGSAVAAYMEFADQKASFRVRRVERGGAKSAPVVIAGMASTRTSGYPRMALHGGELVFAWVEADRGGSQVRTAAAPLR
ncbi:MAG TPA: sialidase family protein [Vicinamibacterales bacterium]|nr:sialidase family protein [Vicinamibacterales bacterium]